MLEFVMARKPSDSWESGCKDACMREHEYISVNYECNINNISLFKNCTLHMD